MPCQWHGRAATDQGAPRVESLRATTRLSLDAIRELGFFNRRLCARTSSSKHPEINRRKDFVGNAGADMPLWDGCSGVLSGCSAAVPYPIKK